MRLDGALEPRQGAAPLLGRSIGVAKHRRETREKCETKQQQCADEDDDAAATTATVAESLTNSSSSSSNNNTLYNTGQLQAISSQLQQQQHKEPTANKLSNSYENNKDDVDEVVAPTTATTTTATNYRAISLCGNVKRAIIASLKMRAQQSLMLMAASVDAAAAAAQKRSSRSSSSGSSGLNTFVLCLISVIALLPPPTLGDDGDNFFAVNSFSMGPETTTPEFDYASRGQKKFGDKCDNTLECGFPGSICDPKKKSCQCTEDLPVTNHIDKCGKEAAVNESCFFNEQCEMRYFQTECRDGRCACRFEMSPIWAKDGTVECKGRQDKHGPEKYIDPAMIGVLVGMALMFIIICVVLRLFSQARWRENRTIFNTPNPRLMNVSLLRDSKLLHGQERRGSRMSVRAPSRQPSMASLRPHSPNPSLGKTGSHEGSHGSNASATSVRSNRSNSVAPGKVSTNAHGAHHERHGSGHRHQHPHPHHPHPAAHQLQSPQEQTLTNITTNPVAESVTVEIIEPAKK